MDGLGGGSCAQADEHALRPPYPLTKLDAAAVRHCFGDRIPLKTES
jgi:hypothetical protein